MGPVRVNLCGTKPSEPFAWGGLLWTTAHRARVSSGRGGVHCHKTSMVGWWSTSRTSPPSATHCATAGCRAWALADPSDRSSGPQVTDRSVVFQYAPRLGEILILMCVCVWLNTGLVVSFRARGCLDSGCQLGMQINGNCRDRRQPYKRRFACRSG